MIKYKAWIVATELIYCECSCIVHVTELYHMMAANCIFRGYSWVYDADSNLLSLLVNMYSPKTR